MLFSHNCGPKFYGLGISLMKFLTMGLQSILLFTKPLQYFWDLIRSSLSGRSGKARRLGHLRTESTYSIDTQSLVQVIFGFQTASNQTNKSKNAQSKQKKKLDTQSSLFQAMTFGITYFLFEVLPLYRVNKKKNREAICFTAKIDKDGIFAIFPELSSFVLFRV